MIENGAAHETFGFNADFRAAIPAVSGDQLVSAEIEYNGGRAGLTYRYRDESNWYMFWYNGTNFAFGKVVGGAFTLLKLQPIDWGAPGTVRTLSVLVVGDQMTGFIDGVDVMKISGETDLSSENKAGLFARSTPPATTFDNFEVHSVSP